MRAKAQSAIHVSQPVGTQDHVLGPATADVTLIEYGDFECPYSRDGTRNAISLRERFGDRVQFVFRHFPLAKHPHAQQAAEAAEAAAVQGKFWDMVVVLFANQDELGDGDLIRYAQKLGLDMARFKEDLHEHVHAGRVQIDVVSGKQSGVTGTPTWFLNSQRYDGPDDLEALSALVQRALSKA
jgi:protein-disulfide isomerase